MSSTSPTPTETTREHYGPAGRSPWLDIDWRKYQRWISVDDRPINVIDFYGDPSDPPPTSSTAAIVFVHGLSGSWQNWLEQLPVFASAGHRVVALDLPGFGHSPMPRELITIQRYARTLDGVLDALNIAAAAVVGNSMGGFVAAELAIAFPQRVERLLLAAPAGASSYANPTGLRAARIIRLLQPMIAMQTGWVSAHADALARSPRLREVALHNVARHPAWLPPQLAAEQLRGSGKPGFVDALDACLAYDFRDRLPEIVCPTLLVWGRNDRIIPARDADIFMELIPGARKEILDDTGHVPMLERPARFNALLEGFLSE